MAKILIVEDDPMLLAFYTEVLQDEGYKINQASDGERGLYLAREGGYDLILLDVHLPKREGPEILEELAKNPPSQANKMIIMLTNASEPAVEENVRSLGVTKFLMKSSLTPDQFLEEIESVLH